MTEFGMNLRKWYICKSVNKSCWLIYPPVRMWTKEAYRFDSGAAALAAFAAGES